VVVVEGPAGIGKTSVLELAGDAARARNVARPR
jgi:thymidylate kinase